jgi:hypothetical protein
MDPLDPALLGADGTTCAVCEGSVPARSVRLLARRDDLAFVQVSCASCRSTTLAFVFPATASAGGTGRPTPARVTADDVLEMHELLDGWSGGLRELLAPRPGDVGSRP